MDIKRRNLAPPPKINGHSNGNGNANWKPLKNGEDGAETGTDSEAGSSNLGWSDAGWAASAPSTGTRLSLSSSDELPRSQPSETSNSQSPSSAGRVSFTSSHPHQSTISQRRPIPSRGLHIGSPHSTDSPTIITSNSHNPYPSTILDIDDTMSPSTICPTSSMSPNGYPQPNAYYADASAYGFPRARRKSIPQPAVPPVATESEEDGMEGYPVGNGGISNGASHRPKPSKKRSRTSSFTYLPFHRRRHLSNSSWWKWWGGGPPRKPVPAANSNTWWLKSGMAGLLLVATLIYGIILFKRRFEIQLEVSIYSQRWIRSEIDQITPLRGCFDPHNISPSYNLTQHLGPKHQMVAPGISMKRGMACYDFSSTIQRIPGEPLTHLTYHTYWRSDLLSFGERQTATLTAFLATQPLSHSRLILWTNGADVISANEFVKPFLEDWGDLIEVRQVDMNVLTKGTELEGLLSGMEGGGLFDERAWVDGDAVRLLVLWHFGGVWMDMDQILTRDLHPLVENEFVTQWDCYDKPYFTLNGALMHFRKHSPYLCEAFHIMASSPLPAPNTFTWGAHLYSKLHRRLLAAHQKPFSVLPWCFADPRNCRTDVRFPDPFDKDPEQWGGRRWDGRGEVGRSGREMLEEKVGHVWTVHLHNQWGKSFPKGGWIERLLDGYRGQVGAMKRFGRNFANTSGNGGYGGYGHGQVAIGAGVGNGKHKDGVIGTGTKRVKDSEEGREEVRELVDEMLAHERRSGDGRAGEGDEGVSRGESDGLRGEEQKTERE